MTKITITLEEDYSRDEIISAINSGYGEYHNIVINNDDIKVEKQ